MSVWKRFILKKKRESTLESGSVVLKRALKDFCRFRRCGRNVSVVRELKGFKTQKTRL